MVTQTRTHLTTTPYCTANFTDESMPQSRVQRSGNVFDGPGKLWRVLDFYNESVPDAGWWALDVLDSPSDEHGDEADGEAADIDVDIL